MTDCLDCGRCHSCVERSAAFADQMDSERDPDIMRAAARSVIRRRHDRPQDWREVMLARFVLRSLDTPPLSPLPVGRTDGVGRTGSHPGGGTSHDWRHYHRRAIWCGVIAAVLVVGTLAALFVLL